MAIIKKLPEEVVNSYGVTFNVKASNPELGTVNERREVDPPHRFPEYEQAHAWASDYSKRWPGVVGWRTTGRSDKPTHTYDAVNGKQLITQLTSPPGDAK